MGFAPRWQGGIGGAPEIAWTAMSRALEGGLNTGGAQGRSPLGPIRHACQDPPDRSPPACLDGTANSSFAGRHYVRFAPDSGAKADIVGLPSWADIVAKVAAKVL
jgi:hypothetical protein